MDARVIIFWEKDFPFVDTAAISETKDIVEALPPMESVRSVGAADLGEWLTLESADVLINPFGSAFPKESWPVILAFLQSGGHLLNLGGAPFTVPVVHEGGSWVCEPSQDMYYRQLGISDISPVDTGEIKKFSTLPEEPLLSGLIDDFRCKRAYELQVDLTNGDAVSPIRECSIRPLLYAIDPNATEPGEIAAPVVAIDHYFGPFAGGRWVLANYESSVQFRREVLTRLSGFTSLGVSDFQVRPSFACYYPDERATLIVHANRFEKPGVEAKPLSLFLAIRKERITVYTENIDINDFSSPYYREIRLGNPLSPGLYTVEARLSTGERELTDKFSSHCVSGFWCCDDSLIVLTQPLSAGKHTFMRGEKPSPMIGTAYGAADVGERLLYDPNPAIWDRDFSRMDEAGVNVVHSGFRADLRRAMLDSGVPSEEIMRAATALMLTAASHDMSVIFRLFNFTPEAWNGDDAFTDCRSLTVQKEFVAAVTRRLSKFNNILWNLIDEPLLPPCAENPQEAFKNWLAEMVKIVRQNRNPNQLITVGQSDGGWDTRPNPWFYGDYVDFTGIHTSWLNDDALCTALAGGLPDKPSLIMETGILPCDEWGTQNSDTEEESLRLIERKFVTALGSGVSGSLEWMWSAGSQVPGNGRISVGLNRPDRSRKLEYEVLPAMRGFLKELRGVYSDRQPEEVCLVMPQSGMLSQPKIVSSAVRTSLRTMHIHCGIPVRLVGEYSLKHLGKPRMILLPCPGTLKQDAWKVLLKAVEQGSTLLVTGPIESDGRSGTVDRLTKIGIDVELQGLAEREKMIVFGSEYELDFGEHAPSLQKAVVKGTTGQIKAQPLGDGKLIFASMPFETSKNIEPVVALYKYAVKQSAIQPLCMAEPSDAGILVRPVFFKKAALYAIVSELDEDREFVLSNAFTSHAYIVSIPARRSAVFLANRDNGSILANYGGSIERV